MKHVDFDEGALSHDPLGAALEVVNSLAVLDESHPVLTEEDGSLAFLFQHVWLEFCKVSLDVVNPSTIDRFLWLETDHTSIGIDCHRRYVSVTPSEVCEHETDSSDTQDHKRRFKLTHRTFMIGLLRQVSASHKGGEDVRLSNYEAYLTYRRDTIGVEPSYAIIESVHTFLLYL